MHGSATASTGHGDLDNRGTARLAAQFAALPPLAVGYAKAAINGGIDLSLEDAVLVEVEQFGRAFDTDDRREGLRAFLEKRAARFTGE